MKKECILREIARNENGDYYFIYEIPKLTNHIKPGSEARNEVLIVCVPNKSLVKYLKHEFPGSEVYAVDEKELYPEQV